MSVIQERQFHEDKQVVVLKLGANINFATLPLLKSHLQKEFQDQNFRLIINMSNVAFIYSAMVGVLWASIREAKAHGGEVRLTHLNDSVKGVFRDLDLEKATQIRETDAEALADF